jgi:hypothetical protein
MSTSQHSITTTLAALRDRGARHLRISRRRVVSLGAAAMVAGGLGLAAQPAFADGLQLCDHDYAGTFISSDLTATTTPGMIADTYLQWWNGSAWVYVRAGYVNGQPTYIFQRAYSTTDGWWLTSNGRYVLAMSVKLSSGSGTYRLVLHAYAPSYQLDAGYKALSSYKDNLRGYTTWCTS